MWRVVSADKWRSWPWWETAPAAISFHVPWGYWYRHLVHLQRTITSQLQEITQKKLCFTAREATLLVFCGPENLPWATARAKGTSVPSLSLLLSVHTQALCRGTKHIFRDARGSWRGSAACLIYVVPSLNQGEGKAQKLCWNHPASASQPVAARQCRPGMPPWPWDMPSPEPWPGCAWRASLLVAGKQAGNCMVQAVPSSPSPGMG